MSSNYEANRQLTRQRLEERYREAEQHRLARQAPRSGLAWRPKIATRLRALGTGLWRRLRRRRRRARSVPGRVRGQGA